MAEKDEPSLELPSFRLRRRREAPEPGPPLIVDDAPPPVVEEPAAASEPRTPRRLELAGPLAAAIAGLVVGVVAVVLVWASGALCEATSGTSSCGGGPGLLLLALVVVLLTLLGAALLRVFGADHAGSTSTLAVGIATVVTLLLFIDVLDERSGAVAVVLASVVAYLVAQAVTAAATGEDQTA